MSCGTSILDPMLCCRNIVLPKSKHMDPSHSAMRILLGTYVR